jgi:hypothetical protein
MNFYRIKTTAYKEEDFFLLTDLMEEDIVEVIYPIVKEERDGGYEYDNEMLFKELKKQYPDNNISMVDEPIEIVF